MAANLLDRRPATLADGELMAKFYQLFAIGTPPSFLADTCRMFLREGRKGIFFLFDTKEIAFAMWNEHPENLPQNTFHLGIFGVLPDHKSKGFGREVCKTLRKDYWPTDAIVVVQPPTGDAH